MKKVLAVSGGIDSMLLLYLFRDQKDDVIVAHFDHGIRPNSSVDCDFVASWAQKYGLKFVSRRANLGPDCSEEKARQARYDFLYELADQYQARILTAHHANDAIESILINLLRGTGWRGLAPLHNSRIDRPLLDYTKSDIYKIAAQRALVFREDQTNSDDSYLRNRIRTALRQLDRAKLKSATEILLDLYKRQCRIYDEIKATTCSLLEYLSIDEHRYRKAAFCAIGNRDIQLELLREILLNANVQQTRPQLLRAISAIQNYGSSKRFSLDKNHFLLIGKYYFSVITA